MSVSLHAPPVAQVSAVVVVVGARAPFLVRTAAVLALLEFSLDPPQAASATAATASSANVFD